MPAPPDSKLSPHSPYQLPDRIHSVIDPWVAATPDAIALQDDLGRLSYAGLAAAIESAASCLREAGLRSGDRLLVVGENSNAAAVLALAASRLDAWISLVNARLSPREIDIFIKHSGARLTAFLPAISPDAAPHGQRHNAISVTWPGIGDFALGPLNTACEPEPVHESGAEQVAALVYTSGTTGAPKGVMLSHHNLAFIGESSLRLRRLHPGDRIYGVLPLSHVYGLSSILISALHCGATLLLAARFDPAQLARSLAKGGVSVLYGVPTMYAKLLEWKRTNKYRLAVPHLRIAQTGGAPLDQALKDEVEQTFGITLHNAYGMTETSPSIAQTRLESPRHDCSVGQPIPHVEVRILNECSNVAPGEIGELWVHGPNVMLGYYQNPELTKETIKPGGWFDTGDLGRMEEDGALFIMGRSKDLIIHSGFSVYPLEVEQEINAHPDVVHSAVVGHAIQGNEEVIAFIEPVPDSGLTVESLSTFLRNRLAPYKMPSRFVLMASLPTTTSGKILKNQLRQTLG